MTYHRRTDRREMEEAFDRFLAEVDEDGLAVEVGDTVGIRLRFDHDWDLATVEMAFGDGDHGSCSVTARSPAEIRSEIVEAGIEVAAIAREVAIYNDSVIGPRRGAAPGRFEAATEDLIDCGTYCCNLGAELYRTADGTPFVRIAKIHTMTLEDYLVSERVVDRLSEIREDYLYGDGRGVLALVEAIRGEVEDGTELD